MLSGSVNVTTVDEDNQEVLVDSPTHGEIFGFASMLEQTQHQTNAMALEETSCLEVDRDDISVLLQKKPLAGMDMLTVLARQLHAHQQLVRDRASRNPNEIIDEEMTFGNRIADAVAQFGGSWNFIISFGVVLVGYTAVNVYLGGKAWDPYPFILLNLFLSMLAAIQGGRNFADAATIAGVIPRLTPLVSRGEGVAGMPPELHQMLFGLKKGEPTMVETAEGFIVAIPAEIVVPDPNTDKAGYDKMRTDLSRNIASDYASVFQEAVRLRANRRINQANFDQIVQPQQ